MRDHLAPGTCIVDAAGKYLLGDAAISHEHEGIPILHDGVTLGYVIGSPAHAASVAQVLQHLAARDSENRALAAEVLHLYREIHLIEELSEQLAPLLNVEAVAHSASSQAGAATAFRLSPKKGTRIKAAQQTAVRNIRAYSPTNTRYWSHTAPAR